MDANEYPLVRVQGVPGWEDFIGKLIMELPSIDGHMMSMVKWEEGDVDIFPSALVVRLGEAE